MQSNLSNFEAIFSKLANWCNVEIIRYVHFEKVAFHDLKYFAITICTSLHSAYHSWIASCKEIGDKEPYYSTKILIFSFLEGWYGCFTQNKHNIIKVGQSWTIDFQKCKNGRSEPFLRFLGILGSPTGQ